jgi:hypothetical protein
VTTSTTDVLTRAFAHLEQGLRARLPGCTGDPLSPWETTATSVQLAAAGPSQCLPQPVPAADDADCLTALLAALRELLALDAVDAHDGLPRVDLTQLQPRLALVLAEAQSLPR